jgi:hypothetical protein
MATARKKTRTARKPATMTARMSREAKVAYGEIASGVKHLEKSIVEIQKGLVRAEKKIERDARTKVRELRKDASSQLTALKSRQREAGRVLKRLSAAADESWVEIKKSGDSILSDARKSANLVIKRFRQAIGA